MRHAYFHPPSFVLAAVDHGLQVGHALTAAVGAGDR